MPGMWGDGDLSYIYIYMKRERKRERAEYVLNGSQVRRIPHGPRL
jgi:hypothetical protein